MDSFKRKLQLNLLFLYFILFPLGQFAKFKQFNLTDLLVLLSLLIFVFTKEKNYPKSSKEIFFTITVFIFSTIFSVIFFDSQSIKLGIPYLIRFINYLIFYLAIFDLLKVYPKMKNVLINCLILDGIIVSILGILQYILLPDLRYLYYFGWDDHYFRLVSTFLDPAFTGIILVLTDILLFSKLKNNKKIAIPLIFIVTTALLLTYSRSSFIALIVSSVFYILQKNKKVIALVFPILFLISLPFLPRPSSEGVKLERTNSIVLKVENYKDSLKLAKLSPIFGIGFDNVCEGKVKILNKNDSFSSHSCQGLDNSFLFILVTTGLAGILSYLVLGHSLIKGLKKENLPIVVAAISAILIHSLFTNTLFYSWIMGYMAILLGSFSSYQKNNSL
ncbi:O-antigen ligase family protein [Candidatus Woesebacteria bacterium]|nr:O-antigen ligase family protein [Candidatus Woesebacteria bacterium]QQG47152.1 MAG: O-antigen ligase family protein [Candidatus Woesebacteria bacterium]